MRELFGTQRNSDWILNVYQLIILYLIFFFKSQVGDQATQRTFKPLNSYSLRYRNRELVDLDRYF